MQKWKNIYHENANPKEAGKGILTSNKMEF